MSSFTQPLEVVHLGGRHWKTSRAFEFYYDEGDRRHVFGVPNNFKTDFASIPRALWPIVGHPAGHGVQAAVVHDWLYAVQPVSRAMADDIFREGLKVLGVGKVKRNLMWSAVRTFGWAAWRKHAR